MRLCLRPCPSQVVSHRIDLWSPMFPPAARMTKTDSLHDGSAYHFPGLVFREADREVAISDEAGPTDKPSPPMASSRSRLPPPAASRPPPLERAASAGQQQFKAACSVASSLASLRESGESRDSASNNWSKRSSSPERQRSSDEDANQSCRSDSDGDTASSNVRGGATGLDLRVPPPVHTGPSHSVPPCAPVWRQFLQSRSSFRDEANAATGNEATLAQLLEMRRLIKEHVGSSELEVVVIIEGIDPHTSNTFQARHSYSGEDIVFDQSFAPCMSVHDDGMAKLDWDKFHLMKDCPFNASQIIGGSHS